MNPLTTLIALCLGASILAPLAGAQRRGSIYDPVRGPISPIADKTAHRVGDLLTVMINENQDLKNEEKTDLAKNSSLNYQLLNFSAHPNAFSTLPAISTQKADSFGGAANYKRTGAFEARLTAMVVDMLPNGNMVIEGRREIRIDDERKVIEFRGIVRRFDVTRNNTVESELVADAYVSYVGTGQLSQTGKRRGLSGWLYNALDWIWPF
ncbi:Flagellar L-ring protein precursor [Planctomycetes bacterium Poly30]|uniref:Flagellar L-ring protein n=1 Tax=Saltatorellus ferox TaxID=2528018 RepID=A0A518F0W3_9BACT|nr:Flagellar L-ring protein precursor [Planctomycetes bacterium Poly30]